MKRYRYMILMILALGTISGTTMLRSTAQEKPKSIEAAKPIEIQFSPSDAIEIANLRKQIDSANAQIMSIIKPYNIGDNGEFIVDAKGNWIGVRKVEPPKPPEKRP